MTKLWNFIKLHKYAIIWTLGYIATTWAILYFMFDFSIFSSAQWRHLMHAQLRGFPGFVFGILILAALPLYIATTTLILRSKKPLITIPVPKIAFPKFFKDTPAPPPATAESETPTLGPDVADTPIELSDEIPAELRFAFIRAQNNLGHIQTSAFNAPQKDTTTDTFDLSEITSNALPLPPDFEIEIPPFDDTDDNIPTFSEINFDQDTDTPAVPDTTNDNSELIEYLDKNNINYFTDDNIIITDKHAIITHSDSDFWVPDIENWFATGRTCPSPIIAVTNAATVHNRTPAIYLASMNIMNIDKLIPEWQSAGITVITNLSEI